MWVDIRSLIELALNSARCRMYKFLVNSKEARHRIRDRRKGTGKQSRSSWNDATMNRPLKSNFHPLFTYVFVHFYARTISCSQNKRFLLCNRIQHLRHCLRRMLPSTQPRKSVTCKSASIQIMASPFASLKPRTTALLNPRSLVRTTIWTLYPSSWSALTSSTLPSRELSSMIINSTLSAGIGDSESLNALKRRVVRGRMLSFSLYAGTMTEWVICASDAVFVGLLEERERFDISPD